VPGILEAIWIKRAHRGPMDVVQEATLVENRGIDGNADVGGKRQVTLVEREVFDDLKESLSERVEPSMRRANLLLRGLKLEGCRGKRLRIGECLLEMHGETRPCELMDQAQPGLKEALDPGWGGGAYGSVVHGGVIRAGDTVNWA